MMRLLLISSCIPRNTTAGELILFRHLARADEIELVIATDQIIENFTSTEIKSKEVIYISQSYFIERLKKTRLHRVINSLHQYSKPIPNDVRLKFYIKKYNPDIILTVAQGSCWLLAQKMAKEFEIPLVTFFHDWWPEQISIYPWARKRAESCFKKLALDSALAFCVSPNMRNRLGNSQKSIVLYPIPAAKPKISNHANFQGDHFKVIYAGSLSFSKSLMIQSLIDKFPQSNNFNLSLYGPNPDWSSSTVEIAKRSNIYKGFVSCADLLDVLQSASALLVTVSFLESHRCWAETCFPSKLIEYCKFGKPIIIWGPAYCSAVKWAKQYQAAITVTSPSPEDLIETIRKLSVEVGWCKQVSNKALEMSQTIFDPEQLQKIFIQSIESILSAREKV